MRDVGINFTSPVGIFNAGKSPYGCMDMSGNVWEWCATKWLKNYDGYGERVDNDPEGDGSRLLRGGSFWGSRYHVRCAFRNRNGPGSRSDYIGFRVVAPGL